MSAPNKGGGPTYDRALLLHGSKRNEILTLREVQQDRKRQFRRSGLRPTLRHETCGVVYTRYPPARATLRLSALARFARRSHRTGRREPSRQSLSAHTRFTVIDPFAGSCNTLYWILRHIPHSVGIAFEADPQVHGTDQTECQGIEPGHRAHAWRLRIADG